MSLLKIEVQALIAKREKEKVNTAIDGLTLPNGFNMTFHDHYDDVRFSIHKPGTDIFVQLNQGKFIVKKKENITGVEAYLLLKDIISNNQLN